MKIGRHERLSKIARELYSPNGQSYGMPKDFDTIALYYNKDLFDAAGVEYPNADWTWDDLKTAAEKLTKNDVYGFATLVGDQNGYWNFVFQNGGQMLTPDAKQTLIVEPAACDAVKDLYSFIEKKLRRMALSRHLLILAPRCSQAVNWPCSQVACGSPNSSMISASR